MIRVRFHGRGGHGIKTASRILGTAAFLAGYRVQDSPVYGAERRGAAITAFTRINEEPILERGVISDPDLIVVADETLLDDPGAGVLTGQQGASGIFLNAEASAVLVQQHAIAAPVFALDITQRTLAALGTASALSAGIGAAACRLVGLVGQQHLMQAVQEELQHVGLPPESIDKNLQVACGVFGDLDAMPLQVAGSAATEAIYEVTFDEPLRSAPSILAAGNAARRLTGSWRLERPEIDYRRCTRCGICFIRCPDGAIALDHEGYPRIDYDHCKGCMICWQQCPVEGALHKRKEVRAW